MFKKFVLLFFEDKTFHMSPLRKRCLWTLVFICVYRLGTYVPIPGIQCASTETMIPQTMDVLVGGALGRMSLFSLHLIPYVSINLFFALFLMKIPYFRQLTQNENRIRFNLWTQLGTVMFACVQSFFLVTYIRHDSNLIITLPTPLFYVSTILFLVLGTTFLQWIGQQITTYGLGSGIPIIILFGILLEMLNQFQSNIMHLDSWIIGSVILVLTSLSILIFIVEKKKIALFSFCSKANKAPIFFEIPMNFLGITPIIIYQFFLFLFGTHYQTILLLISCLISYFFIILRSLKQDWLFHFKNKGLFFSNLNIEKETYLYIQHVTKKRFLLNLFYLWTICIFFPKIYLSYYLGETGINTISLFILVRLCLSVFKKIPSDFLSDHTYLHFKA